MSIMVMITPKHLLITPLDYIGAGVFDFIESTGPKRYRTTQTIRIYMSDFAGLEYMSDFIEASWRILTIRKGFRFDGASGPAIDGVGNMLAALIHDALYQMRHATKLATLSYRKADALYRRISIAQGAGKIRAWTHWGALRGFGWMFRMLGITSTIGCLIIGACIIGSGCVKVHIAGDWVHRGQHVVLPTNAAPVTVNIENLQEGGTADIAGEITGAKLK